MSEQKKQKPITPAFPFQHWPTELSLVLQSPSPSPSLACSSSPIAHDMPVAKTPEMSTYVSVFRIDGVPILPPLMTTEKRKKMQKYKEKAMFVEGKLNEIRSKVFECADPLDVTKDNNTVTHSSCERECNLQRLNDFHSDKDVQEDVNASFTVLSNMLKSDEHTEQIQFPYTKSVSPSTSEIYDDLLPNASKTPWADKTLAERMGKLQISEIFIYDNRSNAIIVPVGQYEKIRHVQGVPSQRNGDANNELDASSEKKSNESNNSSNININCMASEKDLTFTVQKVKQIPSICVNPPTPLVDVRTVCDSLDISESFESVDTAENNSHVTEKTLTDELTSEESCLLLSNQQASFPTSPSTNVANYFAKSSRNFLCEADTNSGSSVLPYNRKPPQRSATSPSINLVANLRPIDMEITGPTISAVESQLIRSNSFTLESPSTVLIEHMRQQRELNSRKRILPSPSTTRDTVESKAKRVQKADLKSKTQSNTFIVQTKLSSNSMSSANMPYAPNNALLFKTKRSPYESRLTTKPKFTRQMKGTLISTNKSNSKTKVSTPCKPPQKTPNRTAIRKTGTPAKLPEPHLQSSKGVAININILSEAEAEHRQKFYQLIAQQQAEQERLRRTFEAQQKMLLEQLTLEIGKTRLNTPCISTGNNFPVHMDEDEATIVGADINDPHSKSPSLSGRSVLSTSTGVISGTAAMDDLTVGTSKPTVTLHGTRCVPRKLVYTHERRQLTAIGTIYPSAATTRHQDHEEQNRKRQLAEESAEHARREHAATVINAHVRGYLVRRLFQTDQIQRIVQTIQDTLVFVLSLHMEGAEHPEEANTPENIKLKTRVLQQLISASRTLHLVLFQTTMKERMDIIARDRKRIHMKLLNMKRSSNLGL